MSATPGTGHPDPKPSTPSTPKPAPKPDTSKPNPHGGPS